MIAHTDLLARRHRSLWVFDPVAPGTGVEPRPSDADQRHRQQVVACGDATAAVHDRAVTDAGEACRQFGDRLQVPVAADVLLVEDVDRAGDVTGHLVDGLVLAAETVVGAGVDQCRAQPYALRNGLGVDDTGPRLGPRVLGA